jgi:hypothetical protein
VQADHDRLEALAEDAFELGRLVNVRNFPSLAGERA